MSERVSEGDNSNSSSENEDALKREPLLPIVCLPFWKKKSGLAGRGRELDVIHGLLFQFLMPARQNSTYLFLSYSPALPIVYVQMEGLCKNRSSAWPTCFEVSGKVGRPIDTRDDPCESSSGCLNFCGPEQLSRCRGSLRPGRSWDRFPVEARFSAPVQTGYGA
jgi:hypothetical protein